MQTTRTHKKAIYITGSILLFLSLLILAVNLILGYLIENKVREALDNNKEKNYHVTVRTVRVNILTGNVNFKDLEIKPDSLFLERVKKGEGKHSVAIEIKIPTLRFAGIHLYQAVTSHQLIMDKILFRNAGVKVLTGSKPKQNKIRKKADKAFSIDSIYIQGVDGVDIGAVQFSKCDVQLYDLLTDDVVIQSKELEFNMQDFYLEELEGGNDFFRLHLENLKIELTDEKFQSPDANYYLKFDHLRFDLAESLLEIDNLAFKPTYSDIYELARKLKFSSEIYDVSVHNIKISSFDLRKIINNGTLLIDSVQLDGLNVHILIDKRLPFNEERRPKLPHQAIKNMTMPLYIGRVSLTNSYLKYQERLEDTKELMTVDLDDLNVQIYFVTSIKDSIRTGKPMRVNLQAKFMKTTPLHLDFLFPLTSRADTFYYSGHLSSAKMKEFNKASLPALGLKFNKGNLKEVQFSGSANTTYSKGKIVMLYDNLEAEFVKKNEVDRKKFMSWAANSVILKSNPGKNNKLRTASMEFNRVMYKGFGNFIWKTLQNGIMHTVLPAGKKIKPESDPKENKPAGKTNTKKRRKNKRN